MLGDDEHPVSFLFQTSEQGQHTHVLMRAGLRPHRALIGELTLRTNEWAVLRHILELGAAWAYDDDSTVTTPKVAGVHTLGPDLIVEIQED